MLKPNVECRSHSENQGRSEKPNIGKLKKFTK